MSNDSISPSSTDEPEKPAADTVPTTMGDRNDETIVSSTKPLVPEASPAAEPAAAVTGMSGKKSGWGRRLGLAVVVLALLGGAIWAAMSLNKPAKPTVAPVTKKDVSLLRIGVQEPTSPSFYPNIENNTLGVEENSQVFEGLTKFQNKTRVVPALATSWSNPDSSSWVFKLRQGVKFHNGDAFNAQAVKASFDASKSVDFLSEFNDTMKTITVIDANTIKIVTDGPDPLLLNKLTELWVWDTKGPKANDSGNGTGPYVQKPNSVIDKDGVKLAAYDQYYGGRPTTREVDFINYPDNNAILAGLKAGKLDMGHIDDAALVAQAGSGFKRFDSEGLRVSMFVPNTLKVGSPLANKTVREAIYTGLDPLAFMKDRNVNGMLATQIVPPSVPGFDPAIKHPAQDVARAKQLLAQAGYPNGFNLKFSYYTNSKDVFQLAQKQFAALGITLTPDEQSDGPTLQSIAYGGKTDIYYVTFSSDLIDTSDVFSGVVFQQKNYNNADVTKLSDEAATTLDQAKRLKQLQQMNDTFMADYGAFPLYNIAGNTWVVRNKLHLEQQNLNSYVGLEYNQVYAE